MQRVFNRANGDDDEGRRTGARVPVPTRKNEDPGQHRRTAWRHNRIADLARLCERDTDVATTRSIASNALRDRFATKRELTTEILCDSTLFGLRRVMAPLCITLSSIGTVGPKVA